MTAIQNTLIAPTPAGTLYPERTMSSWTNRALPPTRGQSLEIGKENMTTVVVNLLPFSYIWLSIAEQHYFNLMLELNLVSA